MGYTRRVMSRHALEVLNLLESHPQVIEKSTGVLFLRELVMSEREHKFKHQTAAG